MSVDLVTFDVDGTLVRRHPDVPTLKLDAIDYAFRKVFEINNFSYLDYLQPNMYGMTDRSIMRMLATRLGVDSELIENKLDIFFHEMLAYFDNHPEHKTTTDYYVLPGVTEMLAALAERNIKMGIATGNFAKFAWWKLDGVGLGDYFAFGGFGDDAENRDQIIGIALKRANYSGKRKACHFGDTPVDIEAAQANGILAAAISSKAGATYESDALNEAGADLVIDSWHYIDKILAFLDNS
ncbi:MAG: HAD family hydrolase [candidate division Zixibacteria bacterium]|nr:HAD family hydrolase [candidate division Zixibacteria bacterium]